MTALPVVPGCGVIIEVLPYLEVSCVSDETSKSKTCPRDHENQGSLITLAWGKASEDSGHQREQVRTNTQDSLEVRFPPSDVSSRGEEGRFEDRDDVEPTLVRSDSAGHAERLRVDEQRATFPQVTSETSITVTLHLSGFPSSMNP